MKSTSNKNKSQKSCLAGLFKLFVACSSWRILKHRLNHIFDCHLLRIFESFQNTSKIPTFTLLIKTNAHAQLHLKMLSCNFYFLKNLTDFRHIILQPAGKFNPNSFSSIQDGYFRGCSRMGKGPSFPKICHTHPTMMKLGTVTPYLKKIQKIYKSYDTSPEFCWHQHFFTGNQQILFYQEIQI